MKNPQKHVYVQVVTGIDCAMVVIAGLMYRCTWFVVQPLPDDEWEIMVETNDRGVLERILTRCLS